MITYSSGKFLGLENAAMTIKLRDVTDSTALQTLLKAIEGKSDASLQSRRFEEAEAAPIAVTAGCKIMRVCILVMKDNQGQIYKMTVPGVKASVVELDANNPKNEIMKKTDRDALATAYGVATGKTSTACISSIVKQHGYQK